MRLLGWYKLTWKRCGDFSGRSRRKEFWVFFLVNVFAGVALNIFDDAVLGNSHEACEFYYGLGDLYWYVALVPSLSVTVRRLHDIGKSGWWFLFIFLPIIGAIFLFVFLVTAGQPDKNLYGTNRYYRYF